MIRALYNLGKIYESNDNDDELKTILENPNENGKYPNVIKLKFKYQENKIEYEGYDIEEFSLEKLERYLYKRMGANAGDYTPTSKVTEFVKTLKNMKKAIKKIDLDEFKKLFEYLEDDKNLEDILNDLNEYNPKDRYILTTIKNDKWLNEYKEIVELLKSSNDSKYYKKYSKVSLGKNKKCYCCKKEKAEVYGFVNTYNFYTVDKSSFVSGGFKQEDAWKNYPVCKECANTLEKGKKYLESKFLDSFSGLRYMVIPKSVFVIENEEELEDFKIILESFEEKNKISLAKEKKDELFNQEKISMEAMSGLKNNLSFNIMFYDMPQKSVFNILMNVEEVLPSRLRRIFETKKVVESREIYKHLKLKKDYIDLKFTFGTVREFFGSNDNKYFLEIINKIFIDKPISYYFLLEKIVSKIRFNKGEGVVFQVKNSLLMIEVLEKLDLLKDKKKGELKNMIEKNEQNSIYLDFFEEHKETFDTDLKRAIFLEGILTQKLLNLPEQESKSFYSRLNSLKLNERVIKRIFVEVINKLNEYKKNYYRTLESLISEYFTSANFKKITNDEMSYYFVLGMNSVNRFKEDMKNNLTNILDD